MYILLLTRGIPTKRYPQWGCFEKDQAEALAGYGHKVVCMSVDARFIYQIRRIGITQKVISSVHYYNIFLASGKLLRLILGDRLYKKCIEYQYRHLYKRIEKDLGRPDIIYSHFFFNTYWGVYLKQLARIPLVAMEHAGRFNYEQLDNYTLERAGYAYSNGRVDALISVSETLREHLKHHFNIDSTVVHNLVSSAFFSLPLQRMQKDRITLTSVGRLDFLKGYDVLVSALSLIRYPRENWQAIIVGDGPEKENLNLLIDSKGLNENVKLIGSKQKDEIARLLAGSDIFVHPSRLENFSVAILEGLASGLPVIASDCGGIRECLNERNGVIFPVGDVNALRDCIDAMCANINEYSRTEIRKDACRRFSGKSIASQLTEIFNKVLEDVAQS